VSADAIGPLVLRLRDVRETPRRSQSNRRRRLDALLENKDAPIYGAGGSTDGAVARASVGEGSTIFFGGPLKCSGARRRQRDGSSPQRN